MTIGGISVTRDTDPATASIGAGHGGSGPAVKIYVGATISIAANAVNQVGQAHVFTITVTQAPDGATPATTANITTSVSPAPSSSSTTCGSAVAFSGNVAKIGMAHNRTPVTGLSRNPSSALKKSGINVTRDT